MLILEENFRWHLEAFASELFIYIYIYIYIYIHSGVKKCWPLPDFLFFCMFVTL